PASRSDLYAAFAVDLAIYLAGDCHLGAGQSRSHVRALFDDDRAGALDLALHRAMQANGALTLQRAFEMGALANQALYFGSIRMHAARHSPRGLADVHVARHWTKTRAPGAGGGAARWSWSARARLACFGGRARRRGIVALFRQRAAEARPLLVIGFLEHQLHLR